MPTDPGQPTLDQLRVFLEVIDAGSFAGAARKLRRATSVVSYAIANLEAQLGVDLFDRETTQRPRLTDAGRAVLADVRTVTSGVELLRAKVTGLSCGLEAELHVVFDVMYPGKIGVEILKAFRKEFPTVTLFLNVEALGAVTQMILARTATLGVSGPFPIETGAEQLERIAIGSVRLAAVAAPDHPLALAGRNPPGAGRDHVQLVLTDRSSLTQGRDFGVAARQTWRLADLSAKLTLLRNGLGWGTMPLPFITDDLASGRLVRLDMPEYGELEYALSVIYRTDTPPGPAARWFIERLREPLPRFEPPSFLR